MDYGNPNNTYALFVSAKFYCNECDSHIFSNDWSQVGESYMIHCPNHEPEDDE
jgi:hypothetical protein